ncbi:1729_t:CDS:2, partial [Funneliformis caledonium]
NTVKNSEEENECNEDKFDVDMDADKNNMNINECDINNADEIPEFSIEAEEQPVFEHIHNYALQIPKLTNQIILIDIRSVSGHTVPRFPDAAYAEFMDLVSTHHFSNSARNDVLKWFRKHHL